MRGVIIVVCFLVSLIGLILGPGYYSYQSYFSGSVVTEKSIDSKNIYTLPGAQVILGSKKNDKHLPLRIDLDPGMNPIVVDIRLVELETIADSNMQYKTARFKSNLTNSKGDEIWNETVEFRVSPRDRNAEENGADSSMGRGELDLSSLVGYFRDNFLPLFLPVGITKRVKQFNIDTAGTFALDLAQLPGPKARFKQLRYSHLFLKVRKNVTDPQMTIVWTGVALLILGVIGIVMSFVFGSKEEAGV